MSLINSEYFAVGLATIAVEETRAVLSNGNNNPYSNVPGSQLRSNFNIVDEMLREKRRTPNVAQLSADPIRATLCDAKLSIGAKTGNCEEHASVAFAFLFITGNLPFAKCEFPGHWDHAFVLLGDLRLPLAICDPWANIACSFTQWHDWKKCIWGDIVPPDNDMRVVAALTQDPGSLEGYKKLTSEQHSYCNMDISN